MEAMDDKENAFRFPVSTSCRRGGYCLHQYETVRRYSTRRKFGIDRRKAVENNAGIQLGPRT
jgi:hypothetical protein